MGAERPLGETQTHLLPRQDRILSGEADHQSRGTGVDFAAKFERRFCKVGCLVVRVPSVDRNDFKTNTAAFFKDIRGGFDSLLQASVPDLLIGRPIIVDRELDAYHVDLIQRLAGQQVTSGPRILVAAQIYLAQVQALRIRFFEVVRCIGVQRIGSLFTVSQGDLRPAPSRNADLAAGGQVVLLTSSVGRGDGKGDFLGRGIDDHDHVTRGHSAPETSSETD